MTEAAAPRRTLVGTQAACAELGLTPRELFRWVDETGAPCFRMPVGHRCAPLGFYLDDVRAHLRDHPITPRAEAS